MSGSPSMWCSDLNGGGPPSFSVPPHKTERVGAGFQTVCRPGCQMLDHIQRQKE